MNGNRKGKRLDYSGSCELVFNGFILPAGFSDVSSTGCSLALDNDTDLVAGSIVWVLVKIESDLAVGLHLKAKIAWVKGCMVGCQFAFASAEQKKEYLKLIKDIYESRDI